MKPAFRDNANHTVSYIAIDDVPWNKTPETIEKSIFRPCK